VLLCFFSVCSFSLFAKLNMSAAGSTVPFLSRPAHLLHCMTEMSAMQRCWWCWWSMQKRTHIMRSVQANTNAQAQTTALKP
jgi:hypothetical protein